MVNVWLLSALWQQLECCRWRGELTGMRFHCGSILTSHWHSGWRMASVMAMTRMRSLSLLMMSMTTHQNAIPLTSGMESLPCLGAALLPQTSVQNRAHPQTYRRRLKWMFIIHLLIVQGCCPSEHMGQILGCFLHCCIFRSRMSLKK